MIEKRFASRRDPWLVGVLGAVAAAELVAAAVLVLMGPPSVWVRGIAPALLVGSGLLITWSLIETSYVVRDGDLVIRSGPFRWRIPLDAIEAVSPSRAWTAAPSLSFDRLRIRRRGSVADFLVSPEDRDLFLATLVSANAGLRASGDRLMRAQAEASAR